MKVLKIESRDSHLSITFLIYQNIDFQNSSSLHGLSTLKSPETKGIVTFPLCLGTKGHKNVVSLLY